MIKLGLISAKKVKMTALERKLLDKLRLWIVLHPGEDWQSVKTCQFCSYGKFQADFFNANKCDKNRVWINNERTKIRIGMSIKTIQRVWNRGYTCCGWLL